MKVLKNISNLLICCLCSYIVFNIKDKIGNSEYIFTFLGGAITMRISQFIDEI